MCVWVCLSALNATFIVWLGLLFFLCAPSSPSKRKYSTVIQFHYDGRRNTRRYFSSMQLCPCVSFSMSMPFGLTLSFRRRQVSFSLLSAFLSFFSLFHIVLFLYSLASDQFPRIFERPPEICYRARIHEESTWKKNLICNSTAHGEKRFDVLHEKYISREIYGNCLLLPRRGGCVMLSL